MSALKTNGFLFVVAVEKRELPLSALRQISARGSFSVSDWEDLLKCRF